MDNIYDVAKSVPSFKKIEASSVLFTEYKCMETRSVFMAWTHVNYFVYVLKGHMKWRTLNHSYMVYANDTIFVKKGANIINKYFDEDFCALIIFIPDDFIRDAITKGPKELIKNPRIESDAVIPVKFDKTLKAYFNSLYTYFFSETTPLPQIIEIKFKELIYNLLASSLNSEISSYFMEVMQSGRISLKHIMESNFIYNLTLNEYAKLSNRSLSSFKREFKKTFDISPGRWLTQMRLQYAQRLLETTNQKVFEVAFESGFENPSHFTRAFKEKNGITPLEFKKSQVQA